MSWSEIHLVWIWLDAIRLGEIELAMSHPPILPNLGVLFAIFKLVGPVWFTTLETYNYIPLYPIINIYIYMHYLIIAGWISMFFATPQLDIRN